MKFVFFGSSEFSTYVLDELKVRGVEPSMIVTIQDKPKGRKLVLSPNVVKEWANANNIQVVDSNILNSLQSDTYDFFLVASYGKIIKKQMFDLPKFKTLNIHPSLLPKYRGASPIQSQILNDEEEIGTSIMLIDEGVDTGPVLGQRNITKGDPQLLRVPLGSSELERLMARESVGLLLKVLPEYLGGKLKPKPQDSSEATYCDKIKKEDGELDMPLDSRENSRKNLLKIKAFARWPRSYYFHNNRRIIVTDATLEDGKLKILKVIPEGKREMAYGDFLRGNR